VLAATAALGAIDIAPAVAAGGGSISGTVTAAAGGAPLAGVCVGALTPGLDPIPGVSAETHADGTYLLSGVVAGPTIVKFYSSPTAGECGAAPPTNFVTQWWNNQSSIDNAQQINVTNGSSTTGVDAAMVAGGTITGTVTNANGGAPLNQICVLAYEDGVLHPPVLVAAIATNADGTYTLEGAPPGNVDVEFNSTGTCPNGKPATGSGFAAQWYNNQVQQSASNAVAVTSGGTTPNINAAMAPAGTIAGKVTAAVSGLGLPGVCVDAHVATGGDNPIVASVGVINADGTYTLNGVPAGTVTVEFQVDGFCPGGIDRTPFIAQSYNNNPVTVTVGNTTQNINAVLSQPMANVTFNIAVNGSGTSATIARGAMATLSESGIQNAATGTVVFSTSGNPNLCTIALPATSCKTSAALGAGSYGPISASFTDTDGAFKNASSNNNVNLTVSPGVPNAPTNAHATRSGSSATVSWTAPADNGGSAITNYIVTAAPGGKSATVAGNVNQAMIAGFVPGTYTFTVKAKNSAGTSVASAPSNAVTVPLPPQIAAPRAGYWMLGSDGHVYNFGNAGRLGNSSGSPVAMAARLDGTGYWVVDTAGNVRAFGTATTHGGHPALRAGEIVSAISGTPSGNGYWLFTNLGAAYPYGDAHFYGDMRAVKLNGEIIASAATATGHGYYMVGSDGGVFSFGDAKFHGSTGAMRLNKPVVGISPTPDNQGYWLVASDGGVFAFNAPFRGSMGGHVLNKPVNGLVAFGNGYLMVASDGGIFDFSNKPFFGSLGGNPPAAPIIGIAAFATK
jgi:hypothetical protein